MRCSSFSLHISALSVRSTVNVREGKKHPQAGAGAQWLSAGPACMKPCV